MQIKNAQDLDVAISLLENKMLSQEKMLRLQFTDTVDSFKPKNLLKAAYKNATESNAVGSTLLKAAVGVGSTILGSKLIRGSSLLGKLAGSAINASGSSDVIFSNANKITAWGRAIFGNLFTKK